MIAERAKKKMLGGVTTSERPVIVRPARALTTEDLHLIRLPERYWHSSYDLISEGKPKKIVAEYMRKVHEVMSRGYGLLFWGDNGTGKTGAASVIAKHVRRFGYTVLFIRAADLLRGDVNRTFFDATRTQTVYQRACSVDLLVIDDMGKEHHPDTGYAAGYAASLLEDLIRDRSSRLRSIIATTNIDPKRLAGQKDESIYGKSMGQILKSSVLPIQMNGIDHRQEEKSELEHVLAREAEANDTK